MALIPKKNTQHKFEPPLVRYVPLDAVAAKADPYAERIRITHFYSHVCTESESGRDVTTLTTGWTDAQIEQGKHLPFLAEEDCPPDRLAERENRSAQYMALCSAEEYLALP